MHSDLKLPEDVIYQNKGVNCENKDMKSEKQGSCGPPQVRVHLADLQLQEQN